MRVAVCEDSIGDMRNIKNHLNEYLEQRGNVFTYDTFYDVFQVMDKTDEYDIFILDYMMPGMNGLAFAKKLAEEYKTSKTVIFCTSYAEIVFDAFEVNTFRFLVKPVEQDKLFKALDDFIENNNKEEKLIVKSAGENVVIDLQRVLYFESQGRIVYAHFAEGVPVNFYFKFSDLEKELDSSSFFRVHRSFAVRLDKVKTFNSDDVTMENLERIPMSKKKYNEFREAYLKNLNRSHL